MQQGDGTVRGERHGGGRGGEAEAEEGEGRGGEGGAQARRCRSQSTMAAAASPLPLPPHPRLNLVHGCGGGGLLSLSPCSWVLGGFEGGEGSSGVESGVCERRKEDSGLS